MVEGIKSIRDQLELSLITNALQHFCSDQITDGNWTAPQ